ncbi:MAG: isoprenyl transferase [Acutalibacteraceae bacterium]|nr:isoprenyl transferase [Clostridia bacterium]MBQ2000275.1 isoprenyl transferase [Clostridia bacterium]MBQ2419900.1 isoprenyl transferase [Clostridia bacterium]MBQ5597186.1 isoprenyl transferase [Clostridia bacterium]MEE1127447.1 isoprenyl transferase [Acutalibacteraceae bacterium]
MLFKKRNKLPEILPDHIAIIMDGNGRWAKKRGLPRTAGHSAGAKTFQNIARYCNKIGIKYLTVYAFSTENWKRPKDEVDAIMKLLHDYLVDSVNFKDENIKVKFLGDLTRLSDELNVLIADAENNSKDATGLNLNIALNYGGRDEIVNAVKKLAASGADLTALTEQELSDNLYTSGMPDPDLIIRPSGEYRLSNYLIWQSAYAEYWFTDTLWPDFSEKDINEAVISFASRDRRYGGTK